MWFFLFILTLIALVALHFWWRRKFAALQGQRTAEIETSQRRQQQTSVDAKAQQQILFNSMLEGLLLLDRTQKIYLANRSFKNLFGQKVELRGKTILEALRLHELDDLAKRVQAEGQVFDYELKLPDLNERWLQVNAAVINNSAGEREGTILVFHDLTRLKQLERQREEFVANVSHELRTPLSLIKGYTETLLDGARNNPEVAERFLKKGNTIYVEGRIRKREYEDKEGQKKFIYEILGDSIQMLGGGPRRDESNGSSPAHETPKEETSMAPMPEDDLPF